MNKPKPVKIDKRRKSDEGRTVRLSARITPTAYAWLTRTTKNIADAIEALAKETTMTTDPKPTEQQLAGFYEMLEQREQPDPEQDAFNAQRDEDRTEGEPRGVMSEYYDVA